MKFPFLIGKVLTQTNLLDVMVTKEAPEFPFLIGKVLTFGVLMNNKEFGYVKFPFLIGKVLTIY